MNQKEIWKDIKGYEGLYQVSDLGRVRSLKRVVTHKNGCKYPIRGRVLKPQLNKYTGYLHVGLHKEGNGKTKVLHILVAVAFLKHNPAGLMVVVDHINHIKTDNQVINLRVITARENSNKCHLPSSSPFNGVFKHGKKWRAKVGYLRREIYLGTFDTAEEARLYYEEAVVAIEKGEIVKVKKTTYSSRYCCVSWHKATHKWQAAVKGKYLGLFITEDAAHRAVLKYKSHG